MPNTEWWLSLQIVEKFLIYQIFNEVKVSLKKIHEYKIWGLVEFCVSNDCHTGIVQV